MADFTPDRRGIERRIPDILQPLTQESLGRLTRGESTIRWSSEVDESTSVSRNLILTTREDRTRAVHEVREIKFSLADGFIVIFQSQILYGEGPNDLEYPPYSMIVTDSVGGQQFFNYFPHNGELNPEDNSTHGRAQELWGLYGSELVSNPFWSSPDNVLNGDFVITA